MKSPLSCVAVITAVILAGCSPTERAVDVGVRDGVLHIGNGTEPQGLDPHLMTGVPEFHIMDALFEGLVSIDPVTREPAPGVAASWDVSADGRTYTFHLQENARWSDGVPLTAHDFVGSYERIMNPVLAGEYAYLFEIIENGPAYLSGALTDFDQVGVKAPDDHTLVIRLEHPVPYFLTLITYNCWGPLPLHVLDRFNGRRERVSAWTREGNIVGNGPFRLTRWVPNQVLVVERNPHYWDAATVGLNAIHFHPVESIDTEERMFRSGQLHITNEVPPSKIAALRDQPDSPLRIDPQLGTYYYRFNVTRPPFDDVRVRQALALAIDRELLVTRVTQAGQTAGVSVTPPGTGGFEPTTRVSYDPVAARALLDEAGYPGGAGFPVAELLYNTSENHRRIAEAVQQMWKRELGIDVSLYNQEWKVYLDSTHHLNFTIARTAWVAVYDDANQFLEVFTTGNPNNMTGWGSPEYDRLHAESMSETDPQRRRQLLQSLDAMLLREMPAIPIYHYAQSYLIDPRVQGWESNPLDKHPYKHVRLTAAE